MATNAQALTQDQLAAILKEVVESVIAKDAQYQHSLVQQWCGQIVENCIKKFIDATQNQRKYITSCIVLQQKGVGMHASTACHWDASSDLTYTFKYETPNLICLCTVYSLNV